MTVIDIQQAKTELVKLIGQAVEGETIIISEAGRPVAKLTSLSPANTTRRFGSLAGQACVPDDFDSMGAPEIEAMFGM
jgi:prevent-host-death family protein